MVWRLVLAIAAALAARPEAPRDRGVEPRAAVRQLGGAARELAPAPLDTAPQTGPDPATPASMDQQKQPAHWEW